MDDLELTFQWICKLRKDYSPNSDIWNLRRGWAQLKVSLLESLNDGSYQFSPLDRLEFDDGTISLWSSQDMIVLKLLAHSLGQRMADHIPKSCCNAKNHGGLKKAVRDTQAALPDYRYVLRSDIKNYYQSIQFNELMAIIESYVTDPILLRLIRKACWRTETQGGLFYEYQTHGIPKGSPLSPLLGSIALIPLDKAIGQIKDVFYTRFMDDWLVLAKTKTALRKIIKLTHRVVQSLQLRLHPKKTYIGKISHGFNFLGYFMDHEKILPAKETIRRFLERGEQRISLRTAALYERPHNQSKSRRCKEPVNRDISDYSVNEEPPTDAYFQNIIAHLLSLSSKRPGVEAETRQYVRRWVCWLEQGLSSCAEFATSVANLLPSIRSWMMVTGASTYDAPSIR